MKNDLQYLGHKIRILQGESAQESIDGLSRELGVSPLLIAVDESEDFGETTAFLKTTIPKLKMSTITVASDRSADYEKEIDDIMSKVPDHERFFKWTTSTNNLEEAVEEFFLIGFIEDGAGEKSQYLVMIFSSNVRFEDRVRDIVQHTVTRLSDLTQE